MDTRDKLRRIQRQAFLKVKAEIEGNLGLTNKSLKRYYNKYQNEFHKKNFRTVSYDLLVGRILKSKLVYIGDFHTLDQSQRTIIRLIRDIAPLKPDITLGLEFLPIHSEDILQKYIKKEITEEDFLKKIDYEKNWGFPWKNYKPIIEIAMKYKLNILGINLISSSKRTMHLDGRDRAAARIIAERMSEKPKESIIVLMGNYHLAKDHLPNKVDREIEKRDRKPPKRCIIYQNNENIYWWLTQKKLQYKHEIVRIDAESFCLMNSTPLIMLQTLSSWLESKDLIFNTRFSLLEPHKKEINRKDDITEYAFEILQTIGKFFNINVESYHNFHIWNRGTDALIRFIQKKKEFSRKETNLIESYLFNLKWFYIPKVNVFNFKSSNLNHLASALSVYLICTHNNIDKIYMDTTEDFYDFMLIATFAYLGSKIFNHKRKCKGADYYKMILKFNIAEGDSKPAHRDDIKIASYLLDHLQREDEYFETGIFQKSFKKISVYSDLLYYKCAIILGTMLGDRIFTHMINGNLSHKEIKDLFLNGENFKKRRSTLIYLGLQNRIRDFKTS